MSSDYSPVIIHNVSTPPQSSYRRRLILAFIGLFVGVIASLVVIFKSDIILIFEGAAAGYDSGSNTPSDTLHQNIRNITEATFNPTLSPVFSPTKFPTKYPTSFPSKLPTESPSNFPTSTLYPSLSPTYSPTSSPSTIGCGPFDVIFIVDDSSSVGYENYETLKSSIFSYIQYDLPEMNPSTGTRIGYIEFTQTVEDFFNIADSNTFDLFSADVNSFTHKHYGASHKAGIVKAHEMMLQLAQEGILRSAELKVIMITDGNPCLRCGPLCCEGSYENGNGAAELRAFHDDFDFTFYFVPLEPTAYNNPVSLDLFDEAKGVEGDSQGFDSSNFITTSVTTFAEVDETLTSVISC